MVTTSFQRSGPEAALIRLRQDLPDLMGKLRLSPAGEALPAWRRIIENKLLPRLAPDFPLTVAICGGGSAGKSTLFNTLAGSAISPVGGRAGLNRRVLAAIHPDLEKRPELLAAVFRPFASAPRSLRRVEDLAATGDPLYVTAEIPPGLVLLDTPDFDTGAGGVYTNRDTAQKALEAADLFIYIFTNSNYNNRDNTDFIARMLTGIGRRRCFLVYRVYPSFSRAEVGEHAGTVAGNLYGRDALETVLGVYRCDEDNQVAAGQAAMRLQPLNDGDPPLFQALTRMDRHRLRLELSASILQDVVGTAERFMSQAALSRQHLALYRDCLEAIQRQSVRSALQHFPIDQVLRRFAEIWKASDPTVIKFMRGTGRVLDLPLRAIAGSARWLKRQTAKAPAKDPPPEDYRNRALSDLLEAAAALHRALVDPEVTLRLSPLEATTEQLLLQAQQLLAAERDRDPPGLHLAVDADRGATTLRVCAHAAAGDARRRLREREWTTVHGEITAGKEVLLTLSQKIEADLAALAGQFRRRMGIWDRIRQTFAASLNVLPATAAVTYILSTGDPVGAVGIKVKLAGLLGLHDLYALVALPATTGLKRIDESQLGQLLEPLAKAWFDDKLLGVDRLLRAQISGEVLEAANDALREIARLEARIGKEIVACKQAMLQTVR
jgi:hypothetical protein